MIKLLIIETIMICGILLLVLPEDKLVNKEKLNPNQDPIQAVKQTRNSGIILIIVAIVFAIIM